MVSIFSGASCEDTKDFLTKEDNKRNCSDLKEDGTCKDKKWVNVEEINKDKLLGFPTQNCCACGNGTDNNPKCIDSKDWEVSTTSETPSPTKFNCNILQIKVFVKIDIWWKKMEELAN